MAYNSKYTGAQVEAILENAERDSAVNTLSYDGKLTLCELTKAGVNHYVLTSTASASKTLASLFGTLTPKYTHKYINDSSTAVQYNKSTLFHTILSGTTMYTIIDGTI